MLMRWDYSNEMRLCYWAIIMLMSCDDVNESSNVISWALFRENAS